MWLVGSIWFFQLVIYSRFDCEVLSRLLLVFCLGMVHFIDMLNLSSHTWDFSLPMVDIHRTVSNVVTGPRPRSEQPWVQATPFIMRDICRAVSNVVTGPHPTRSIMRSGNPFYELLYEFTLHCHLLGNLSIRSWPFWQWFQISRNSKHKFVSIIMEYGEQSDSCLWK